MSTAIENPTETVVSLRDPITYLSTCNDLRLVRRQQYPRFGPNGESIGVSQGETIKFVAGRFQTTDRDLADWLETHPSNGSLFHEMGFGAEGRTSDDTPTIVEEIVHLGFAGNRASIQDILLAERQTLSRPVVMRACEAALERIEFAETGEMEPEGKVEGGEE